jgi:hypothetical protein
MTERGSSKQHTKGGKQSSKQATVVVSLYVKDNKQDNCHL